MHFLSAQLVQQVLVNPWLHSGSSATPVAALGTATVLILLIPYEWPVLINTRHQFTLGELSVDTIFGGSELRQKDDEV